MEKTKPSLEKYFELPNPGLRAYFKHTVFGNSEDYRPPFWSGYSRDEVLAMWQKRLDALNVSRNFPDLYQYELDMKSKVGPMSIQAPLEDRIESIEAYFADVCVKSEPIDGKAIDQSIAFFHRAGGIRLRSLANTVAKMRLSTNSGNPWFTKRKLVVEQVLRSHVFLSSDWMVSVDATRSSPAKLYHLAAVLGWRGQEGGISPEDVKQRAIWMMSMALNAHELRFYQPAIEAMQKNCLIPAYVSMDAVDREVTMLFDTKKPNDDVICTDFSRFDQHFNRDMQNAAWDIEEALLSDLEDREDHGAIFNAKFEIPLICSEDLMYSGPHGMGSGSGGTNFDECMAHKALQFEAANNARSPLNPHSMAYGDDGIISYPGCNVEDVIGTYQRHGQEMNPTKQYVSKHDCVVLRRWHGVDYRVNGTMVGVYSTFRALGRLLAQERYYDPTVWSKELVTLRALSILENCKWSPYFHEFIDFVQTGDKFKLGLDLPGFFENLQRTAQRANEQLDDFLGYTKSMQDTNPAAGIMQWEVVKYLLSKQGRERN